MLQCWDAVAEVNVLHDVILPIAGTTYGLPEISTGCSQSAVVLLQLLGGTEVGICPSVTEAAAGVTPAASAIANAAVHTAALRFLRRISDLPVRCPLLDRAA